MTENENLEKGMEPTIGKPIASVAQNLQESIKALRQIFTELGLEPKEGLSLARYGGELNGRSVEISVGFRTRNRYSTPSISRVYFEGLIISVAMKTEIKATLQFLSPSYQWLMRLIQPWRGNKHVETLGSPYEQLEVWTHEVAWAEAFLQETAVQSALAPFLFQKDQAAEQASGFIYTILNSFAPSLYPSSKVINYTVAFGYDTATLIISNPPSPLDKATFEQWLSQLGQIASLAEQIPPSQEALPSWLSQQSERVQVAAIVGGLFLIPIALLACCGVTMLTMILLVSSAF